MPTAAQQKRYDAISAVTARFINEQHGYQVTPGTTVTAVMEAIEELRCLGRTERWKANVTRWKNMVKEADECETASARERHLHWAILQGNVYIGHAA